MSFDRIASLAVIAQRKIFASLPEEVKLASILIALASSEDLTESDVESLGLAALLAFKRSGIGGELFGQDLDSSIYPGVSATRLSPAAKAVAKSVSRALIKSIKTLPSFVKAHAVENMTMDLFKTSLDKTKSPRQALVYLQTMLSNQGANSRRTLSRSKLDRTQVKPEEIVENLFSKPSSWRALPPKLLKDLLFALKNDSALNPPGLNPSGYDRIMAYVRGSQKGESISAISRTLGMSQQAFEKWLAGKLPALRKLMTPLLNHYSDMSEMTKYAEGEEDTDGVDFDDDECTDE
jgi:hypothetical protein